MRNNELDKIGFGAWQIGGGSIVDDINRGWSDIKLKSASDLVNRAYSLGIRFFDTSCSYGQGRSEEILGETLEGRADAIICTKYGPKFSNGQSSLDFSSDNLRRSLDQSLKRLRRNSLDYLLMHNPQVDSITPSVIRAFEQAKSEGLIKKYGISVSFIEPYLDFTDSFDCFELLYNPVSQQNLQHLPRLAGKEVFFRSVFASGLLLKTSDFFNFKERIRDWRTTLPRIVFEKAEAYTQLESDVGKRYHNILRSVLDLAVSKVIIGVSNENHLNSLKVFLELEDQAI